MNIWFQMYDKVLIYRDINNTTFNLSMSKVQVVVCKKRSVNYVVYFEFVCVWHHLEVMF